MPAETEGFAELSVSPASRSAEWTSPRNHIVSRQAMIRLVRPSQTMPSAFM